MKTILFLLIWGLSLNGIGSAQDVLKDGIYKTNLKNGMWREITYKNGKKEGSDITFFKNGKPQEETFYVNDRLDGAIKDYYENGSVTQEIELKNGKKNGHWKVYNESGNLLSDDIYKDNLLVDSNSKPFNGFHRQYVQYGNWYEGNYSEGEMDGINKMYNFQGKLLIERKLVKGKIVAIVLPI